MPTAKLKVIHNFLKHCDDGKFDHFEEKPIYISKRGNILTYEISVQNHKHYYNFENSEELVEDFLKNVRSKIKPGRFAAMKCGVLIENYQPGPVENNTLIINTRHWSTETYRTKVFNYYISFSLKKNILKRVIVN